MAEQQFGVVGMAVMGKNLTLNIESRGYTVALCNHTGSKTTKVVEEHLDRNFQATYSTKELVNAIEKPRRIILTIETGLTTDATIQELLPRLDKGGILADGGNTFFRDTVRHNEELANSGINFTGTDVSSGERGASRGPSIIPGEQKEAHELVAPILEKILARVEGGKPCATYIGPNDAGHYVKMVHNGIEYGDMQLIAESYGLMKQVLGLSVDEMTETFKGWNEGELDSYPIEITADILTRKDDKGTDQPIADAIFDAVGNRGTGEWTSQSALDLGVPLPLTTESVFARFISAYKKSA